jgi:hypothetical protein
MNEENKDNTQGPKDQDNKGLLDSALGAAERLEKANIEARAILEEQKTLTARQMLTGKASAVTTEAPKVETPQEYAQRVLNNKVQLK